MNSKTFHPCEVIARVYFYFFTQRKVSLDEPWNFRQVRRAFGTRREINLIPVVYVRSGFAHMYIRALRIYVYLKLEYTIYIRTVMLSIYRQLCNLGMKYILALSYFGTLMWYIFCARSTTSKDWDRELTFVPDRRSFGQWPWKTHFLWHQLRFTNLSTRMCNLSVP